MASDGNKKSDADGPHSVVTTTVRGPKSRFFTEQHNKDYVIGLIVVALLLGIAVIFGHLGQKVYAQAAGHKIYKSDIDGLRGDKKKVSDRDGAMALADKYFTEALAKEQKVTISDKDIRDEYGGAIDLKKQRASNRYDYQLKVNSAYFAKLQHKYEGVYKGYVLVAHFSRYIPAFAVTPAYKKAIPQMGDQASIAADKQYAKEFINKLYVQVKSGQISWDQAASMERNDPRLGMAFYPGLSHSQAFDTSVQPEPLFSASAAQKKVYTLKAGQITAPFVVTVYNPATKKSFDSYFLVVRMDSVYGGNKNGSDFQQYVEQAKIRLGYKINV